MQASDERDKLSDERYYRTLALSRATGWDRESICYEEYEYAKKVRDGVIEDELRALIAEKGIDYVAHWMKLREEQILREQADPYRAGYEPKHWKEADRLLLFSTDYPHSDSHFPDATNIFLKLPLSEVSKKMILWDNCARLYNLAGTR